MIIMRKITKMWKEEIDKIHMFPDVVVDIVINYLTDTFEYQYKIIGRKLRIGDNVIGSKECIRIYYESFDKLDNKIIELKLPKLFSYPNPKDKMICLKTGEEIYVSFPVICLNCMTLLQNPRESPELDSFLKFFSFADNKQLFSSCGCYNCHKLRICSCRF